MSIIVYRPAGRPAPKAADSKISLSYVGLSGHARALSTIKHRRLSFLIATGGRQSYFGVTR